MATDVKLDQGDGTFLHLEARVVKALSSDFMLDSPNRHTGPHPHRRALVHDQGDGLTINFADDYPGGVTLNSVREISPHQPSRAKQVATPPTLAVRGGITFEVHTTSILVHGGDGGGDKVTTLDLHQELTKLQTQLSAALVRLGKLEAQLK